MYINLWEQEDSSPTRVMATLLLVINSTNTREEQTPTRQLVYGTFIGIELNDGSILSAYHHWDGYPTWLGRILETHYNTKEKVADLIDGGDMSSAWTNVGWQNETRPDKWIPCIILNAVRIALLVMIRTWKSSSLIMKNTLTSSAMVTGSPTICTSGKIM